MEVVVGSERLGSRQRMVTDMDMARRHGGLTQVAACTVMAAHRRDHDHSVDRDGCHPHAVEVVHLGAQAVMVCHDCRADSGFIAHRDAEQLATLHRHDTAA
jgi:hypothetical protein